VERPLEALPSSPSNRETRVEEVYCAVVPGTHCFVLEDNILTGNCGGRCIKQGVREWLRLRYHFPERFEQIKQWELAQRAKGGARATHAICSTDALAAYAAVIPEEQPTTVGKETGETAHVERWNNTALAASGPGCCP
jgi:hypothetical protein